MLDLIFAKTYNFPIMEKNNINHVFEDSFKISSNAFCIADGITRDLINGDAFFYPKTKEKALEWLNSKGLKISDTELDILIESAVNGLKKTNEVK